MARQSCNVVTLTLQTLKQIQVNVKENQMGNQQWTFQRHMHVGYKIHDEDKQIKKKHNT